MLSKSWWRSTIPADSPGKRLAAASLINNLGSATQETIFPLFLVLSAGIPASQIGTGLLVASLVGLAASPVAGSLNDRYESKNVLTAAYSLQATVSALLIFIHSFLTFCVLMSVTMAATQVARVARMSLLARVPQERRNTLRAQIGVFTNTGVGVGVAISAVVLWIGTREAYLLAFVLDAATYMVAALLQRSVQAAEIVLPTESKASGPTPTRRSVLKDHRYAVVVALNGLLYTHQNILALGIPLWIASTGVLPRAMATAALLINLVLVILLQVRFANRVTDARTAAVAWRRSGLVIAVACGLIVVAAQYDDAAIPVTAVLCAAVCLTLGELWYSAAELETSAGLAPADQMGAYQGFFALGRDTAHACGTLAAAFFCVSLGTTGWIALMALYCAFSLCAPQVLRWAGRPAADAASATDELAQPR
ncbi:hypothetical protein ACZ91_64700 [Streptomyces regensis]|nr:hypothetical protein ACZ91_64700 [Streptomyces regensis]